MATFGSAYLNETTTTVELTSTSAATAYIEYLSIANLRNHESQYEIYYTDATGNTYDNSESKVIIHRGQLKSLETLIFHQDDFPKGDTTTSFFGNDATNKRLYVAVYQGNREFPDEVHVIYKRVDVSDLPITVSYTEDQLQDLVGAMFTGNTEANITATYQNSDGTIDLVAVDTNTTYSEATSSVPGLMSTAHHDKLDGIAAGAEVNVQSDWNSSSGDSQILNKPTIPAAYTDANAVSAVATADDYLKNDAADTIAGDLTVDSDFLYVKDQSGSAAASRFTTATLTANRTLTMPDNTGTIATTNKLIVQLTTSYYSSSTALYYEPLHGYIAENTTVGSYVSAFVAPYDGKIIKIAAYNSTTTSKTREFKMFLNRQASTQTGTTATTASYTTTSMPILSPTDWNFSAGDSVSIQTTNSAFVATANTTFIIEYDTTT